MQGSEFIYIPVDAKAVMPMAEGDSGDMPGYEIPGAYINWDRNSGINRKGWDNILEIENNPFTYSGITTIQEIQQVIDDEGNLNNIFSKWGQWILPKELGQFLDDITQSYGSYKPGREEYYGCIGDKMA